jgi:uncharacterized protein
MIGIFGEPERMSPKLLRFSFSIAALTLLGDAAMGASFDCRPYFKARACPEIVICETPALSQQDDLMARAYENMMRTSPTRAAISLRDEQRLWVQKRKSCGCDASCMADLYDRRLQELGEVDTSSSNPASDNAPYVSRWTCAGEGTEPRRYALKIVVESYIDREGNLALRQGTMALVANNLPSDTDPFPIERGKTETFRITSIASVDVCGKYGWAAKNGTYEAVFCGYTQGAGSVGLTPKGAKRPNISLDCDSVDVD